MRSSFFKYSILLLLGLALILSTCAHGNGNIDPTPDTTIPSTLQVTVTIIENQDASDGKYGSSDVTLQFSTNEITDPNTVTFTHGEKIYCYFYFHTINQPRIYVLSSAPSYSFHVAIPSNPFTYRCDYQYPLNGHLKSGNIFIFNGAQMPLSPVLQRPVGSNPNFTVSYHSGDPSPIVNQCTVQVDAYAPNGMVMGNNVPQDGNTYLGGVSVGGLNGGLGYILMKRTCTPVYFNHHNSANDNSLIFDVVNVTYTSTASSEVSWV
jgi:hypothetical protein